MYEPYFGLTREPFSIAPDPQFLYMSARHREALAHLTYGLRRGGVVLLTGEIGAGKTTVWRAFLAQLPSNVDVAYVVNPKLGVDALLARVCEDLHIERPAAGAAWDPIDAIHGHVLLASAQGRRTLIVVDEAQALSVEVLEQLRLLTNLDTSDRKLVQVLLIGQPELRALLERPELEPMAQRVVARFHLPALPEAETARYIVHRLEVAGLQGENPFDPDAVARVHQLCGGVPRRINVLCDRALIAAHMVEQRQVDRRIVDRAAGEVFGRLALAPAQAEAVRAAVAQHAPAPPRASSGGPWRTAVLVGAAVLVGVVLAPTIAPPLAGLLAQASERLRSIGTSPIDAAITARSDGAATPASAVPATASVTAPAPTASADSAPAAVVAALPAASAVAGAVDDGTEPLLADSVDEVTAWRSLAALWGATLAPGDPCHAAPLQSLHCLRGRGGWPAIRQLGRPVMLPLADARGRTGQAVLLALGSDRATLQRADGSQAAVPLAVLARAWRGEYATLWRVPPGYREGDIVAAGSRQADWLAQRLAPIDGGPATADDETAFGARISAFQQSHGLQPDGLAGPLTLLQINRASGIDEPRLKAVDASLTAVR